MIAMNESEGWIGNFIFWKIIPIKLKNTKSTYLYATQSINKNYHFVKK